MTDGDAAIFKRHGMSVASTQMTELQMGIGCLFATIHDLKIAVASRLAVILREPVITQMRVSLQAGRGIFNRKYVEQGKNPSTCKQTVEHAFNLATLKGVRACKLEDEAGYHNFNCRGGCKFLNQSIP